MDARDVRLDPALRRRLTERARALAPLGSLAADAVELDAPALEALEALAQRLANTYPYGEPRYVGQMLKPPHPVAWAAYAMTMLLNPNNHALDGGPATAAMEQEVVAALAGALGREGALGHLTSSGTIANLEALWVARELHPQAPILVGENAHYTHLRMCEVIGAPAETLPQDDRGRLDLDALEQRLAAGGVGTVVATLGTTSLGALDQVHEIAPLCARHGARLHVDAAYGGFYALLPDGVDRLPFAALAAADSIVIDPHKHGLQPYGCGCVLFADPGVGRLYAHDSPYTYFTSAALHLGEISLECSRAGAGAAALWATLQAIPATRAGLGELLAQSRAAAIELAAALASAGVALVVEPQLDIVCPFPAAVPASRVSEICERAFASLARDGWHAAKLRVRTSWLRERHPAVTPDAEEVTTLRLVLMKPSHRAIVPELAGALAEHLATAGAC